MTTPDVATREPDELIAQVAVLLDRTGLLVWEHGEPNDAESPLYDLGLGVYLARGTAAQLLTVNHHVDEPEDLDERSVLELLTDAESLIDSRTDVIGSDLAAELCDLFRGARAIGC
jgi:hypothetical protein